MKNTLTRRDFLKTLGIGTAGVGAALALAACGGNGGNGGNATGGNTAATNESKQQEAQQRIEEQGITSDFITSEVKESYIRPELKVGGTNPDTLPPYSPNMNGRTPLWEIYQPLYEIPSFGAQMVPILADESKGGNNPDGIGGYDHEVGTTEYTVYMYDYITDSKGNNITADDVVFCYNYYYSEGGNENSRYFEKVEAVDKYTVKFTYNRELDRLMEVAGGFGIFIYSQKAFEESEDPFTKTGVGTGRYILDVLEAGAYMELHRRPDYWQDEALVTKNHKANVEKLRIDFIAETAQKVIALQNHEVDMIESLSTEFIDEFQEDANDSYKVFTYRDNLSQMVYFNNHPDVITSDINMRLAIAWAINYDGLVEAMGKGYAQRLVGPGNANFPDYNPAWADLDNYNTHAGAVDKSVVQEYLDKAGYKGETLEFIGEPGGDAVKYMQIIQSQLMMYGINVHLQNLDRTSSNKVKEDPTAWHMCQQQAASKGYLALVIGGSTWNQHEATPAYGGRSGCFIDDEELANMCDTILTTATHNQENVDKVYNYIMDNCLCCGLMSFYQNVIIPQDMTSLAMTSKNWPLHTACTFADPNA